MSRERTPTGWIGASVALLLLASTVTAVPAGTEERPTPPMARKATVTHELHGDVRIDDYHWMRDRENPEVIAHLAAENAYTEAVTAHTAELQKTLYNEMLGRIKETDLNVPYRKDAFYYYTRTEEGKPYTIYCRKKGSLSAPEQILLDVNELAAGHEYFDLGSFAVSPNHSLLAYSTDTFGSEVFLLVVKNLTTGELLSDEIPGTDYGVVWGNDNRSLFYTTMDEARRSDKLFRHTLGDRPEDDVLVFYEPDPAYGVWIDRTKSDAYLILSVESHVTSEQYVLDADTPAGEFALVRPRQTEIEYSLVHHGDWFYILTNEDADNYKLMRAPVGDPSIENWETVIPARDRVKIERVSAFRNHIVLLERDRGVRRVRVLDGRSGDKYYVHFDDPVYAVYLEDNHEYDTSVLRFSYMSYVTPKSVFDYDMDTHERELKKQREVLGGYDPSHYTTERIYVKADDGTVVPISMVYKKGCICRGGRPLYLMGYGAYGASMDPWFSSNRLSLLDRGFIYAVAHVRGGGEMGEEWRDSGRMFNKMNTFTDYIACAENLICRGFTSPERLVAVGGSAGGLLVGAVANMRPDLFHVIVADVPFVDVLNTMLDPSIPLTVSEYDEWGNPNEREYYDYMKAYSPYDNVMAQDYPHMLITGSLNDPRVQYWEPAKWTAKLRAMKTDTNELVLKTNMGAGHGGASGRYGWLRDIAFEYAYIIDKIDYRR
jgi:oligopeptidase B